MTPVTARRTLLTLSFTRWFPVGLVVGVTTLLPLERGLTVAEALAAAAVTGFVVFALELPTSGFADAFGRRRVYLAAAVVQIGAAILFTAAHSFWAFVLASAAFGIFRALDSGPLEAWYVDTVHRTRRGTDTDISRALAAAGAVLGVSIAIGALIGGGLIWWHPVPAWSALTLPYAVYAALACGHLVAVALLMKEPPLREPSVADSSLTNPPVAGSPVTGSPAASPPPGNPPVGKPPASHPTATPRPLTVVSAGIHDTLATIADGIRLLRTNRVLLGLVLVEVFWSLAMIVFETFQPIRLAEILAGTGAENGEAAAGALNGPVTAVGWAVFAGGSALAGLASPRLGVTRTAILARVLNGLGAVVMGLVTGPAGLIAAYLFTYALHGSAGPMHSALLHREAEARNRATVLSLNSMVAFGAFSVGAVALGQLAGTTSNQTAMVAAGALSVLGAFCYLPTLRRERPPA
ncbi:MFS transporter [Myceligenerans crystallogenes]|uniref:Major facilitator superfamily (MFS) profile domain-containing protein n=1 Tax=Myceligenerans crystallogenes TaxID=316335 RepID=A0ABP4ZJY5_9MICO